MLDFGSMDLTLVNESSKIAPNDLKLLAVFESVGTKYLSLVANAWDRLDGWCVSVNDGAPGAIPASYDGLIILTDYPSDPDAKGAAAVHDEVNGKPLIEVFVGAVLDNGGDLLRGTDSVIEAYTHELAETFGDQTVNRWRMRGDGALVTEELCDGLQGSPFDLTADDGTVTSAANFAYQPYFDIYGTGRFDHSGAVSAPFSRLPTGYDNILTPGTITQEFGAEMKPWMVMLKSRPDSRIGRMAQRTNHRHVVKHGHHQWWRNAIPGGYPTDPPYARVLAPKS